MTIRYELAIEISSKPRDVPLSISIIPLGKIVLVLNGPIPGVLENDLMRGELSNGGLHVVLPQELCKGATRKQGVGEEQ